MSVDVAIQVGVVIERRPGVTSWQAEVWRPVAVLAGAADVAAWSPLGTVDGGERFFLGHAQVWFHRADTPTYRDNLATGSPRMWVRLRLEDGRPRLIGVTADPAEGEAFTEAGNDLVDHVLMPGEVAAALARFVETHHVERVFLKRRRDRGFEEDEE